MPCTVAEVLAGDRLRLALRLGWNIVHTVPCRLAGVAAAEPSTEKGAVQREQLDAAIRSVVAEGGALQFTSLDLINGEALGQLTVVDPQGGRHDIASVVFDDAD